MISDDDCGEANDGKADDDKVSVGDAKTTRSLQAVCGPAAAAGARPASSPAAGRPLQARAESADAPLRVGAAGAAGPECLPGTPGPSLDQ